MPPAAGWTLVRSRSCPSVTQSVLCASVEPLGAAAAGVGVAVGFAVGDGVFAVSFVAGTVVLEPPPPHPAVTANRANSVKDGSRSKLEISTP